MKRLSFVALAAFTFATTPLLQRVGALPASLVTVALGASLALLASGTADALAVALGAGAAFAGTLLGAASAPIASAVMIGLVFAERSLRVRTRASRGAHVGLALAAGAAAGLVTQAYRGTPPVTQVVAALVAGVLVAAPFLVDADDPIAHALGLAAEEARGPVSAVFARGAELRRAARDVPLDRGTSREIEDTWRALVGLAGARLRLDRRDHAASPAAASVLAKLDERIGQHVDVLNRAYTAVDAASAEDAPLRRVAAEHTARDEEREALAEIEAELAAVGAPGSAK